MPESRLAPDDADPLDIDPRSRFEPSEHLLPGEKIAIFAHAFENAPDGIQISDLSGHVMYANKAIEKIYGYSPDEQRGTHVSERNADLEISTKHIIPAIKSSGEWEGEILAKHKDGRIFPVWLSTSIINDDQGKPIALMGISREITEQKKAEEDKSKILHTLGERVKELNSLYKIAKIAAVPNISLGEVCQQTVEILPGSWQYPEITCARISVLDQIYKTSNFKKSKWTQTAEITANDEKTGIVEVSYLKERPVIDEGPFLQEERNLIEGIAERMGHLVEREQANKMIEAQISRQNALLSATNAFVYLKDRDLKYMAMNSAMAGMLGIDESLVAGKTDFDLFPEHDANSFRTVDSQVMESGVPVIDIEEQYETPEGETRWALTSKVPYKDIDGVVIGMVGTSTDITSIKSGEAALKRSETKYRKLLELANDAVFIADVETGIIIEANRKASELIGRPIEEIIGLHHSEVHPPEQEDQNQEKFQQHVNENEGATTELLVRHASGRDIPVEVSSSVVELDGKKVMKGIFRDLTKRHRAKELSDALNDLSITITSTLDFDEIVQKVVVAASETLGAESCAVMTHEANDWVVRYTHGRTQTATGTHFTDEQAGACTAAVESGKPLVIKDAYHNDLANPEIMKQYGIRSILVVPLIAQDQVFGVMSFQYYSKLYSFPEQEVDWASKLGKLLSLSFRNAGLYADQRRINQELEEAQSMAHFGYWERDVATSQAKWSDELYRIYGVDPATFNPNELDSFINFVHPEDRERVQELIAKLFRGISPFEIEYRIIRADGEVRWVSASGDIDFDEFNKPVTMRGTTQDITKSKQDEITLNERETKYRSLFGNMIDGFAFHKIVVDGKGKPVDYIFLEVNEAFEKLTGLKGEEIVGKKVTEALPGTEKDPADWIGVYGKVALGGGAIRFEQFSEGVDKWFSVSAFCPMPDHFMVVFEDITERKQIERSLVESETKYRKLLDLANDAVFVADAETGILLETNQKGCELIGRPLSEIIGMHQSKLHPPDKAELYRDIFEEYVGKGQGITVELLARHASGHDVPVEISASVLKLGEKVLIKGIFRDLTTRNRAKELSDNLNEINSIINSTLRFSEVIDKVVASSSVAIGADSAAFFLLEGDHWILEQVHGPSPHEPGTKIPYEVLNPPTRMVENPEPVAISDAYNDDRSNKEMAKKVGLRSLLLVPLVSDDQVLGLLVFRYFTEQKEFVPEEVDFSRKLGASISLALENARLFSEQQRIASVLQESLLIIPEKLPHIEFGHLYRAASDEAMVGGDFYDLFALQGDRIGVVVGDVSGKGLQAAALTSTLKHMLKSYAYEGHSPGAIVSKTNMAAMKELDSATFVTVFVGILDTQSGVLTYCCAGHPPPIIKRQNGDIDLLDTVCPPIGVLDFLTPADKQQLIKEGDFITIYTDGVIEARCAGDMFGEGRLLDLIKNSKMLLVPQVPEIILGELSRCGCALSDDIAIISLSLKND